MRTYDLEKIKRAMSLYDDEIVGFHPEEWVSNPMNIALINEHGDVGLFEHQAMLKNTVCAHYFFFSRGKQAVKVAQDFLVELFSTTYVKTILGLTPEAHKGALWMNRRLGCKEYGTVDTVIGPCRFVILTKEQWKDYNQ